MITHPYAYLCNLYEHQNVCMILLCVCRFHYDPGHVRVLISSERQLQLYSTSMYRFLFKFTGLKWQIFSLYSCRIPFARYRSATMNTVAVNHSFDFTRDPSLHRQLMYVSHDIATHTRTHTQNTPWMPRPGIMSREPPALIQVQNWELKLRLSSGIGSSFSYLQSEY